MKKNMLLLFLIFISCGDDNILKVKNGLTHLDKNATIENIISKWSMCEQNITWSESKDSYKHTLVEARCDVTNASQREYGDELFYVKNNPSSNSSETIKMPESKTANDFKAFILFKFTIEKHSSFSWSGIKNLISNHEFSLNIGDNDKIIPTEVLKEEISKNGTAIEHFIDFKDVETVQKMIEEDKLQNLILSADDILILAYRNIKITNVNHITKSRQVDNKKLFFKK